MMRPQHSPPSSSIARRLASGGGGGATSRNLLFDAGSSGPADAHVGATRNLAQGFSVPQFAELYQARSCVQFDAIYAWELRPMNRTKWYDALAPSLRKKVDFRNVGVAPEPAEGVRNASSVLQTLRAEARPADFVVLKLDIDSPNIELSIVRTIVSDPSLSRLVDEFFFEYHYKWSAHERHTIGAKFWRGAPALGTVDDALKLMRQLREAGVRAHFWI